MISHFYKNGTIKKDFNVLGLCVLAQNVKDGDVLYLKNNNKKSLSKIVSNAVPQDLRCFIVTTGHFDGLENYSHIIVSEEYFEADKAKMIDYFYPAKETHYVGVTGTNGKTTTCWLLSELARIEKKKPLYIGTIGSFYNGKKISSDFSTTTPSYLDLRKLVHSIEDVVDLVILEISSHALEQKRLSKIKLNACSWTNFSQDHLDFHSSMEDYFKAKSKIVEMLADKVPLFFNKEENNLFNKCTYKLKKVVKPFDEIFFSEKAYPLFFQANYNKKNIELAHAMYLKLFKKMETHSFDLCAIELPPGRFEEVKKGDVSFVIDYAHTPDALEKLLKEIKKIDNERKVICVVGCGGDRDSSKRPLMASVCESYSDYSVFTTDNPRSEDPQMILSDMEKGINKNFEVIVDREEAIKKSFVLAKQDGAIVVIAGKGHENYQEVKGIRHYFSDKKIVEDL